MGLELYELLDSVSDEESVLCFVRALLKDHEASVGLDGDASGRGPNGWENETIEAFLEAALAWGESTEVGKPYGTGDESLWKRFALFLLCGKTYE